MYGIPSFRRRGARAAGGVVRVESRLTNLASQILKGVASFLGTAAFLSVTYAGSPLR